MPAHRPSFHGPSFRDKVKSWGGKCLFLWAKMLACEAALDRVLAPFSVFIKRMGVKLLHVTKKRGTPLALAKFAAICATLGGTATAMTSAASGTAASTGLALTAVGAGSYAVIKGIPVKGYEITKHVPPTRSIKPAVSMYKSPLSNIRSHVTKKP